MTDGLKERLEVLECLPTVMDYKELLHIAAKKFLITRNQAREKYGLYTYKQWEWELEYHDQAKSKRFDN